MKRSRTVVVLALFALGGCGAGIGDDGISTDPPLDDGKQDSPDFFAKDPPPRYCGPATQPPPPVPGGTPDCPADKNREGCPCTQVGQTAPCWPGLRANRNHGACKDGVTTCMLVGEIEARWGRCEGHVLPTPGVSSGPEACRCFSKGRWEIDNMIKCMVVSSDEKTVYAVSTTLKDGKGVCPSNTAFPPVPDPGPWSANRLTVDCAGQFKLCFTIKTGDRTKPSPTDCVVARSCVEVWYPTPNQTQELPPLPSWSTTDPACSTQHYQIGGYAEMTVEGKSIECDDVGDAGGPRVFHRRGYCRAACNTKPAPPGCDACGAEGKDQGDF